jgi:hypothetical protein
LASIPSAGKTLKPVETSTGVDHGPPSACVAERTLSVSDCHAAVTVPSASTATRGTALLAPDGATVSAALQAPAAVRVADLSAPVSTHTAATRPPLPTASPADPASTLVVDSCCGVLQFAPAGRRAVKIVVGPIIGFIGSLVSSVYSPHTAVMVPLASMTTWRLETCAPAVESAVGAEAHGPPAGRSETCRPSVSADQDATASPDAPVATAG